MRPLEVHPGRAARHRHPPVFTTLSVTSLGTRGPDADAVAFALAGVLCDTEYGRPVSTASLEASFPASLTGDQRQLNLKSWLPHSIAADARHGHHGD
jgi:hypothetical protein